MKVYKGLLIDIDDTLIRFRQNVKEENTGSLMTVLHRAGQELGGLPIAEVKQRMSYVKHNVNWWCWNDFIKALELSPAEFWDYAFRIESEYLEQAEPGLPETLSRLKKFGLKLFVTSNNPNTGIRHKLRLAGIQKNMIDILFDQLLGATEMRAMKWEPAYWERAVAATGIPVKELAVIGDDLHDDYEIPHSFGLPQTYLLNRKKEYNQLKKMPGLLVIDLFSDLLESYISTRETCIQEA